MKLSFFDIFPTPKFIAIPRQGIDISDTAVRFVELGVSGGQKELRRYAAWPLSPGVIEDGLISQPDQVVKALNELRVRHDLRLVRASLPEERAYLFKTEVPVAALSDLKTNIEFKIEENVPLSPSEALFGFKVLSDGKHNQKTPTDHLDVVVAVLPRTVIESYLAVFHQAQIQPISFHIESQAITNAVITEADPNNYLLVHVGRTRVGIYVVNEQVVHFASTLALRSVADLARNLVPEVIKVKNYWLSHQESKSTKDPKISDLIISGVGASDDGLKQLLGQETGLSVRMADAWRNVASVEEKIPEMSFAESLEYVGAVGLALAD